MLSRRSVSEEHTHGSRTHNHGDSLREDLPRIRRLWERRRALGAIGSIAGIAATGLGGGLLRPRIASASNACVADPQETSGPYPADGTNQSEGSTSDILTASGIVRHDIRRSFLSSTTLATGVQLLLHLAVGDETTGCGPESSFAVYVWHCDQNGHYSLYSAPTESYLRGVQVSGAKGGLSFKTIFPACYSGRWPHIHVEVFKNLSVATNGENAVLTTQLAMPSDICSAVYSAATGYSGSSQNFSQESLSTDNVFGNCTSSQLAVMTPTFNGSVSDGYRASAVLNVTV